MPFGKYSKARLIERIRDLEETVTTLGAQLVAAEMQVTYYRARLAEFVIDIEGEDNHADGD